MAALLQDAQVLVLPTVAFYPLLVEPYVGAPLHGCSRTRSTCPASRRWRCLVPSANISASLQLIGPPGSEDLLLATAAVIEATAGYRLDLMPYGSFQSTGRRPATPATRSLG